MRNNIIRCAFAAAALCLAPARDLAQTAAHPDYKALSEAYYKAAPTVGWAGKAPLIVYETQGAEGREPWLFDPRSGKREPLLRDITDDFAARLAALSGDTTITRKTLSLSSATFCGGDRTTFYIERHGKRIACDRRTARLTLAKAERRERPAWGRRSAHTADSAYTMMGDRHNLWVRDNRSGALRQITTQGREWASYCFRSQKDTLREGNAAGFWLGHKYIDLVTDDSEVGELYIIDALREPRPTLTTRKMPLPGEKGVRQTRLFWYDADKGEGRLLPVEKFKGQKLEMAYERTERDLWFTRRSRGVDTLELCRVDVPTGRVSVIISEVCRPHLSVNLFTWRLIDGGRHIVWWSERSGRGQYYLYDRDGRLLNRITSGPDLVAGAPEHIDTVARTMTFAAYCEPTATNPAYRHYYIASLDGRWQRRLTYGDGYHDITFSDDRRYFLDRYSRPDMPPVWRAGSVARPQRGHEVTRASDSVLRRGHWHAPRLVSVMSPDEHTPLYGLMYTPAVMDTTRSYPIISNVYPGPQDDQIPLAFTIDDNHNQTLADQGCVVVNIAPRGSSPYRGRDFLAFGYGRLRDYPLADDRHAILQLARQHAYIDSTRVGIYGHSGGGAMATAAMLTYPDFYKVGVAASGNHDNNIYIQWWGETWHGKGHIPTNMELAPRLKGDLLLIHGDVDDNVPMASTLRMADALIRAGKRFDMMIMPGKDHGLDSPYYFDLIRRYFTEHLISPTNFKHPPIKQ